MYPLNKKGFHSKFQFTDQRRPMFTLPLFLIFLSCSDSSHSFASRRELQTQAPSTQSSNLSLHEPIDLALLLKILSPFFKTQHKSQSALRAYDNPFHNTSTPENHRSFDNAYIGGVYDPLNNQIVFVPSDQSAFNEFLFPPEHHPIKLHRYDCLSNTIEAYDNPFHALSTPAENRIVGSAYRGGVYDPINRQIVFIPQSQSNHLSPNPIKFHRYDCSSRTLEAYDNPFNYNSLPEENRISMYSAYTGGVYDPINHQIIFVPHRHAAYSKCHRYDIPTKAIEIYDNPFHSTSSPVENRGTFNGYYGGVYDPLNQKIIFVPSAQGSRPKLHRYNCSNQSLEVYDNPFHSTSNPTEEQMLSSAYRGGVYDPFNQKIIFVPARNAPETTWHRYDCASETIEAYTNPFHLNSFPEEKRISQHATYVSGVYDPINSQIIFVPSNQQPGRPIWHRYNCLTQTVEAYNNPFHSTSLPLENRFFSYLGAVHDPLNNQVVFIPYGQASQRKWHVLQHYSNKKISRDFAAHYLFNKF
jgi:hypothetical protein